MHSNAVCNTTINFLKKRHFCGITSSKHTAATCHMIGANKAARQLYSQKDKTALTSSQSVCRVGCAHMRGTDWCPSVCHLFLFITSPKSRKTAPTATTAGRLGCRSQPTSRLRANLLRVQQSMKRARQAGSRLLIPQPPAASRQATLLPLPWLIWLSRHGACAALPQRAHGAPGCAGG